MSKFAFPEMDGLKDAYYTGTEMMICKERGSK